MSNDAGAAAQERQSFRNSGIKKPKNIKRKGSDAKCRISSRYTCDPCKALMQSEFDGIQSQANGADHYPSDNQRNAVNDNDEVDTTFGDWQNDANSSLRSRQNKADEVLTDRHNSTDTALIHRISEDDSVLNNITNNPVLPSADEYLQPQPSDSPVKYVDLYDGSITQYHGEY